MSTDAVDIPSACEAASDLTALGRRLEFLRIDRGLSKQRLASRAHASRQQIWRVMTGKSELTGALRERLASALDVDSSLLTGSATTSSHVTSVSSARPLRAAETAMPAAVTLHDYVSDSVHLTATLATLPMGDGGHRLKRALLTALDDLAIDSASTLPPDFAEIRRRVLAGDL